VLRDTGRLQVAQVYARIQSPQTANLLTRLQALAERKENVYNQLEGALAVLERQRCESRIQILKERLDRDDQLKQMLAQIAQKGPNLRNAGIYQNESKS
jgi:hypothetical protein